jgi:hypothetical protein
VGHLQSNYVATVCNSLHKILITYSNRGQFFGGGDKAEMAAAILVILSTTGSMISVAYTCVRGKSILIKVEPLTYLYTTVKQTIGWTGVLPWSSIWRRSAPVREKYKTLGADVENPHSNNETPVISKGTPEGGIILHWIVSVFFVIISIGVHPVETAISFAGPLLVYGHFFVSCEHNGIPFVSGELVLTKDK